MLRKRTLNQLEKLGLGHLAASEATFYRYDGRVHGTPQCYLSSEQEEVLEESEDLEVFTSSIEALAEKCCPCATRYVELDGLRDALQLVQATRGTGSIQVPARNSLQSLNQASQRLALLEETIDHFGWALGSIHPPVQQAMDRAQKEFEEERDSVRARIRAQSRTLLREYAEALNLASLEGHPLIQEMYSELGRLRSRIILRSWHHLVWKGLVRQYRSRHLSKMSGSIQLEDLEGLSENGPGHRVEVEAKLRQEAEFVARLEDELERRCASSVPNVLVTIRSTRYDSSGGRTRTLVEAHTVAEEGEIRLLLLPETVWLMLAGLPVIEEVAVPDDPLITETAIRLWDPATGSNLATLKAAVAAAQMV